jgi:anti-sigma B factor antagonist
LWLSARQRHRALAAHRRTSPRTIALRRDVDYLAAFRQLLFVGRRMSVSSYAKDGILTIVLTDARILDDAKIEKVGNDLIELLNKTTEERVILDFRNVKFMTSSMLGKIVQVHKKAAEFKVKMKLAAIDAEIRQVFKITRLDKLFDIESDEAAARAAFMKRGWFG